MIYLLLSIFSSTAVYAVFRLIGNKNIPLLPAILINYLTCILLAFILIENKTSLFDFESPSIIWKSTMLGFLFVIIFLAIGKTARYYGVAVVSVASKMSLVIPVCFIMIYYGEKPGLLFWPGLAGSLAAIYLLTFSKKGNHQNKALLYLPVMVWLGSGVIDSLLKYLDYSTPEIEDKSLITTFYIFAGAFVFGFIYYLFTVLRKKNSGSDFSKKTILWGVLLGIPNLFSIWFLLLTIGKSNLSGAVVFPVNNSGIVLLSVIVAALFFKEQFTLKKWLGLILAIISIVLLSLDTYVIQ